MIKEQRTVKSYFFMALAFLTFSLTPLSAKAEIVYQTHTLSNGMQIVVIPNHRAPVVSHMVWYKVGAAAEPAGKSGIAHFFEHLMFQATPSIAAGTFSKTIKKYGGNDNAFTSQDYTAYYQNIAKEHLAMVMRMEADRMQNLILSEDAIKAERDVIIEERRQRIDNNARARFREKIRQTLFPTHPYGTPVIGWKEEMENLNREDALKFYRQYYAPNNAILVVAGDITMNELKPLAEEYYGANRISNITKVQLPAPAPLKQAKRVDFKSPQAGTNMLQIAYRAPRGYDALELVADLLGGNNTDFLYQELVIKDKVATHVEVSYFPITMGPSSFNLYATPAPDVTLETLEKAVHEKLTQIIAHGFSEPQIEQSKKRLIYQNIYQADSLQGPAMRVGMALTSGFDLNYLQTWETRIKNIQKQDIMTAMQHVFTHPESKPVIATMRIGTEKKASTAHKVENAIVTQETLQQTPTKTADEIANEAMATELNTTPTPTQQPVQKDQEIEDAAIAIATTIAIAEEMERSNEATDQNNTDASLSTSTDRNEKKEQGE